MQLPAFLAALIGLGLNYAAYESEIYRGALEAVPSGQLDAARTLGLSERQTLVLVRGPQAFRLALAPMTNDFVALLKDSSLVSVITVVELTKETSIFAANIGSWLLPGRLVRSDVSRSLIATGAACQTAREGVEEVDVRSSGFGSRGHARIASVVQGVSFAVERGESVTVMGASGSGKTSVLRAIAGLDPIAAGRIVVDGVSIGPGRTPCWSSTARVVSACRDGLPVPPSSSSISARSITCGWRRFTCCSSRGRRPNAKRSSCSSRWASLRVLMRCPMNSREERRNAWRSPVRWRWGHRCC